MTTTELKVFCIQVSGKIHKTQGGQIFMDELIRDADTLYNYIKSGMLQKTNFPEDKKDEK